MTRKQLVDLLLNCDAISYHRIDEQHHLQVYRGDEYIEVGPDPATSIRGYVKLDGKDEVSLVFDIIEPINRYAAKFHVRSLDVTFTVRSGAVSKLTKLEIF